jgi:cellobiose-specific phosphotransferase system component IIA
VAHTACKTNVLLSQSARKISNELVKAAKRDIEPSLRWAAVQIEALVPVDLTNEGNSSVSSDELWSFPSDRSILDEEIPDEIIIHKGNVRLQIFKALSMLGKTVIKSLKPGVTQAVVHLLKNHTSNPMTKDQLFSKEEIANFITEVSEIWSNSLKLAVNDWSQNHLDQLLGFVKRILSSIGQEILKRLGLAAGLMNIDTHHG